MSLALGLVAKRFRIGKRVGKGAFGDIYSGIHFLLHSPNRRGSEYRARGCYQNCTLSALISVTILKNSGKEWNKATTTYA